jgi:uncharacterized membrane protein YeiB
MAINSCTTRISSIDILRGVALLGLLLIHMPEFGLPGLGFASIVSWDRGTGFFIWLVSEIMVEGWNGFGVRLPIGGGNRCG